MPNSTNLDIVIVAFNAPDFLQLLLESLSIYTENSYRLIIIDNNIDNIGHGPGLNLAFQQITSSYVAVFDNDCHVLSHGWDTHLLNQNISFLAGKGVPQKPIRPAFMFMRKEIAQKYDWAATPGYQGHRITPEGFDVGIQAYYQMKKDQVNVKLLPSKPSRYSTLHGEEFIDSIPLVYHHWHGSHLNYRGIDYGKDLFADKENLFRQIPWRQDQLF